MAQVTLRKHMVVIDILLNGKRTIYLQSEKQSLDDPMLKKCQDGKLKCKHRYENHYVENTFLRSLEALCILGF